VFNDLREKGLLKDNESMNAYWSGDDVYPKYKIGKNV